MENLRKLYWVHMEGTLKGNEKYKEKFPFKTEPTEEDISAVLKLIRPVQYSCATTVKSYPVEPEEFYDCSC